MFISTNKMLEMRSLFCT